VQWSGPLPSRMWAGHLNIAEEGEEDQMLFYWFCEAEQTDPATSPVALWTNGGPGSDSLGGFFTELGPFVANEHDDGATLRRNPYTWNLIANVLYLTHPTGIGYSYSADDVNVHTDESDGEDNAKFLRKFFAAYPEFASNDFWLTGESYAGIYIPMTAAEISKGNDLGLEPHINLVGLFVGNGCTGNKTPSCGESDPDDATSLLHTSSGQRLRVLWGHAMISDALYESVVEACPTQISMIPDCMVTTTLPECGVVSPNFNSDR
jgi:carboxypeptidase C (cathepsin A)